MKAFWRWITRAKKPVRTIDMSATVGTNPQQVEVEKTSKVWADISHWTKCDFIKYNAKDLIFKATQGDSFIDSDFHKNLEGCLLNGIRYGFYHFYDVRKDPIAQAKHFISATRMNLRTDMYHLPILDYENNGSRQDNLDLAKNLNEVVAFCKYVYENTGHKVRIYTGDYLMGSLQWPTVLLRYTENPWVARYSKEPPKNSGIWDKVWAWQFSEKYNGIKGLNSCDANRFME